MVGVMESPEVRASSLQQGRIKVNGEHKFSSEKRVMPPELTEGN